MSDRTESLKERIVHLEYNRDLIKVRISEYVSPTEVPLQLKKDLDARERELEELKKELQSTQRPIPPLLPYMSDRTEQEEALEKAIKQLNHDSPCPVVCLIHGDEYQCHDMFVQRLLDKSLPLMLYLKPDQKVESYCFTWPTEFKSKEQFHEKLERSLLTALRRGVKWQAQWDTQTQTAPSTAEINRQFADYQVPVFIHTHVMTTDWLNHKEDMLMWFLEFWQKWPPLTTGQRLFVCWFMKYELKKSFNFLKTRGFKNANRQIKEILEPPGAVDQRWRLLNRIICTVMPALKNITLREAQDWARDDETKIYCDCDIENVITKISSIYKEWERETASSVISMGELANQLKKQILT